jgi:predicted secreted protein
MANLLGERWLVEVSTNTETPSYVVVGCQAAATFEMSGDTIEANCKNSGAWSVGSVSSKSWTMTLDAYVDFGHNHGLEEFETSFVDSTPFLIRLKPVDADGDPLTGGSYRGGTGIVTSITANAPDDDFATYTINVQGQGAPTIEAV